MCEIDLEKKWRDLASKWVSLPKLKKSFLKYEEYGYPVVFALCLATCIVFSKDDVIKYTYEQQWYLQ